MNNKDSEEQQQRQQQRQQRQQQVPSSSSSSKRLILIRHGRTYMNEYLAKPGSRWGDAGFTDIGLPNSNELYRDSPLSENGIEQAKELNKRMKNMNMNLMMKNRILNGNMNGNVNMDVDVDVDTSTNIDLIVVSPLTRAFQTFEYGLLPHFLIKDVDDNDDNNVDDDNNQNPNSNVKETSHNNNKNTENTHNTHNSRNTNKKFRFTVPIITQPLASERVYLISDLGLTKNELKEKFPYAHVGTEFDHFEDEWWFKVKSSHDDNDDDDNIGPNNNNSNSNNNQKKKIHSFNYVKSSNYKEWRPNSKGQKYACLGEPEYQFNQRMVALYKWLDSREETTICLISHWGVLDWLTGLDFENCELKDISFENVRKYVEEKYIV